MSARDQQLVDKLQAAIPRAQLILHSTQRQHEDAAAVVDALATALTLLRPPTVHSAERRIRNLEAAIVRSGRTVQELAYITSISEARLRSIAGGDAATQEESRTLRVALPDWQGGFNG